MFLNTPQCNRLAFSLLTFWVTKGYLVLWHVFVATESRNSFLPFILAPKAAGPLHLQDSRT